MAMRSPSGGDHGRNRSTPVGHALRPSLSRQDKADSLIGLELSPTRGFESGEYVVNHDLRLLRRRDGQLRDPRLGALLAPLSFRRPAARRPPEIELLTVLRLAYGHMLRDCRLPRRP